MISDGFHEGDRAYCRNCGGKFEVKIGGSAIAASLISGPAPAAELEPEADTAVIARTVRTAVAALPIADLMAVPASR